MDGLPDRWELAHQFDPFTAGEANLDPDKDGVVNIDEFRQGTHPRNADSDGDGIPDFLDLTPDPANDPDFVEVRLRTRDSGKVNNGMNCAFCHTTVLKAGQNSHFSEVFLQASEKSFWYRKGSNYSIYLSELFRDLPPATPNTGNPTTSARYDAELLAPANLPRAFVVNDPNNRLAATSFTAPAFRPTQRCPLAR